MKGGNLQKLHLLTTIDIGIYARRTKGTDEIREEVNDHLPSRESRGSAKLSVTPNMSQ